MKNALPFLFVGFHDTTRIRQKRVRNVTRLHPKCGMNSDKMRYFDESKKLPRKRGEFQRNGWFFS
jgi:hypothetical protein